MRNVRLINKHKKDCISMRNVKEKHWKSPWVLAEHDYIGGKIIRRPYYIWRCNDPDCKAQLAIRTHVVDDWAYRKEKELRRPQND